MPIMLVPGAFSGWMSYKTTMWV